MRSRSLIPNTRRPVMLMAVLMSTGLAQGGPVVIYNSGNTQPLAPYLSVFAPSTLRSVQSHAGSPLSKPTRHRASSVTAGVEVYLPVRTPRMSPGKVVRRALGTAPLPPMFLVGSDTYSQRWLTTHHDRLLELGATGLLVQAESLEDLQTIARLGRGLKITPVSANDVARQLGIKHYPVLISHEGIEQ